MGFNSNAEGLNSKKAHFSSLTTLIDDITLSNTSLHEKNMNISYLFSPSDMDYIGYLNSNQTNSPTKNPINLVNLDQSNNYWALLLLFFPIATVFGNILVVMSVVREKNLRTVTNYFVVSLAIADLIVATAVMPFAVYYEVTKRWNISKVLCDAWVATDVMGSTASILNLVAIAIDR
jgi:hypothetical protein